MRVPTSEAQRNDIPLIPALPGYDWLEKALT